MQTGDYPLATTGTKPHTHRCVNVHYQISNVYMHVVYHVSCTCMCITQISCVRVCLTFLQILSWFADSPQELCPFSLHSLMRQAEVQGYQPGDWYGPSQIASIMT